MKNLFLVFISLIFSISVKAQKNEVNMDFIQSVGFSYYTNILTSYPAIHYEPRWNFWELSNKQALSLNVRIAGGYFESNESFNSDHYPTFDFPITVNYNYGCASTKVSSNRVGYYTGIGWNFQLALNDYLIFGPMAQVGFRFDIDDKSPIDLNLGYMYDISGYQIGEFMLGIQYCFGMLK